MKRKAAHLKDLEEIRAIMERATTFMSLNGISGVLAGFLGLAAGILVAVKNRSAWISAEKFRVLFSGASFTLYFILVMAAALVFTLLLSVFFSTKKARKQKLQVWNRSSMRFLTALFIPVISGGLVTAALFIQQQFQYFFPATLIFYGLGLINSSVHTLQEVRYLGISVLILGLAAMFWIPGGLLLWCAGFGVQNICYGAFMARKYAA